MIPKVKTWQVTYYLKGKRIFRTHVDTINRDFAHHLTRWSGPWGKDYDRITIGLKKKPTYLDAY